MWAGDSKLKPLWHQPDRIHVIVTESSSLGFQSHPRNMQSKIIQALVLVYKPAKKHAWIYLLHKNYLFLGLNAFDSYCESLRWSIEWAFSFQKSPFRPFLYFCMFSWIRRVQDQAQSGFLLHGVCSNSVCETSQRQHCSKNSGSLQIVSCAIPLD